MDVDSVWREDRESRKVESKGKMMGEGEDAVDILLHHRFKSTC